MPQYSQQAIQVDTSAPITASSTTPVRNAPSVSKTVMKGQESVTNLVQKLKFGDLVN